MLGRLLWWRLLLLLYLQGARLLLLLLLLRGTLRRWQGHWPRAVIVPKNDFRPLPPTQLAMVVGEGVVRARFVAAGGVLHLLVAEVGRLAELADLLRGVAVALVRCKV